MPISRDTLRGYILEEVLAYLTKNAGYDLLVDYRQDRRELTRIGAGLAVKGRGAVHQADVLGELRWIPAFTFPIRLFVEAKFHEKRKTGIGVVSNAVGVVLDVNQNNMPTIEDRRPLRKFQYAYAIFSTTGFSLPAHAMAVAHQISLIDMSGPEYSRLRGQISSIADSVSEPVKAARDFVPSMRHALRTELGTIPGDVDDLGLDESIDIQLVTTISQASRPAIRDITTERELFVGMANGPYMLLLKSRSPEEFLRYASERPRHRVTIHWSTEYDRARTWVIQPTDDQAAYSLEFRVPRNIYRWVFEAGRDARLEARRMKRRFFSSISIYRRDQRQDKIFRLEYDPTVAPRHIYPEDHRNP